MSPGTLWVFRCPIAAAGKLRGGVIHVIPVGDTSPIQVERDGKYWQGTGQFPGIWAVLSVTTATGFAIICLSRGRLPGFLPGMVHPSGLLEITPGAAIRIARIPAPAGTDCGSGEVHFFKFSIALNTAALKAFASASSPRPINTLEGSDLPVRMPLISSPLSGLEANSGVSA